MKFYSLRIGQFLMSISTIILCGLLEGERAETSLLL